MSASLNALEIDKEEEEDSEESQTTSQAKLDGLEPQEMPGNPSAGLQEDLQRLCIEATEQVEAKGSPHTLHTNRPLEDSCESMEYQQMEIDQQKESVPPLKDHYLKYQSVLFPF